MSHQHSCSVFTTRCLVRQIYRMSFLLLWVFASIADAKTCDLINEQLKAFKGNAQYSTSDNSRDRNYCEVAINSSSGKPITIRVFHSGESASYTYAELAKTDLKIDSKFVSISNDKSIPCSASILGSQFLIFIYHSETTLELHMESLTTASGSSVSKLSAEMNACNKTIHDGKLDHEIQTLDFKYQTLTFFDIPENRRLTFSITRFVAKCPDSCNCSLSRLAWKQSSCRPTYCNNSQLVVYEPGITGISFANSGLDFIQPNSFKGLDSVAVINLDHNNIKTFPGTICSDVPKLQVLKLGHNGMTCIPPNAFNHPCQRHLLLLELNDNKLKEDHKFLIPLISLRRLDLSHNRLMTLSDTTFTTTDKLNYLDLSFNEISNLTNFVFNNLGKLLTHLNISNNQIQELPRTIFKSLKGLLYLNIQRNNISLRDTDVFDSLKFLTKLDLSNNKINNLPSGIFNSVKIQLEYLNLSNNCLVHVGLEIFSPESKLKGIDLSNNLISRLEVGTTGAPKSLKLLRMNNNLLSIVQEHVTCFMMHVLTVELRNNTISSFMTPPNEAILINLNASMKNLFLRHNNISQIPNVIRYTPQIKILDLSNNLISTVTNDSFRKLKRLELLDLSYNNIRELPTDIFLPLGNLVALDVSGNKISQVQDDIFGSLFKLKILDFSGNHLKSLPSQVLSTTKNLSNLDLSKNMLNVIPTVIFEQLTELVILNLSKNSLNTLPSLSSQIQLKFLDLSSNEFCIFTPGIFMGLESLIYISLSFNRITRVSAGTFESLGTKLEFADLSHNAIQSIDPNIFSQSQITLDLRENALKKIQRVSFRGLRNATVLVDEYATCCFTDTSINCVSRLPQSEFLTCKRMLPVGGLRFVMWILGIVTFVGNGVALYCVIVGSKQRKKVQQGIVLSQNVLLSNLAASDFLMGVNLLLLSGTDAYYHEFFPSYSEVWRNGSLCQMAGFLSILSSEGSVFFITLISIDRLICVKYPLSHSSVRKTKKTIVICVTSAWTAALILASLSIASSAYRENGFKLPEVCTGIPIVRGIKTEERTGFERIKFPSMEEVTERVRSQTNFDFLVANTTIVMEEKNISHPLIEIIGTKPAATMSIIIFVGINLLCFSTVAYCYAYIFVSTWRSSSHVLSGTQNHVIRMAKRLFALVLTDFLCWVPIGFICILAQFSVINVSPTAYAWVVGFILPINSTINPFLYTLYDIISDRIKSRDIGNSVQMPLRVGKRGDLKSGLQATCTTVGL